MTDLPPHTNLDAPARAPAQRDPITPERDEHALVVPARAQPTRDYVDDVGEASFPASDPPSWWGGH